MFVALALLPEGGPGLEHRGRFYRQQLHRVVAHVELVAVLEGQLVATAFGNAIEEARKARQRPAGRGRGDVKLQDVGWRPELVRRAA